MSICLLDTSDRLLGSCANNGRTMAIRSRGIVSIDSYTQLRVVLVVAMDESYQISDTLWEEIKPLLPPEPAKPRGGRPRTDNRKAMEAILYILHTGCRWDDVPRSLGARSTVYRRFQEWRKTGVYQRMWVAGLLTYEELRALVWYGKR